jgi:hypothetical protein
VLPGSDAWCAEHAIDPDVWAARGVWRYSYLDRDAVKDAFRPHLPKSELGTVSKVVNQSSGQLMPKHAPPGYPPIPPQLRPDTAVVLDNRTTWHQHGLTEEWPVFPEAAGRAAGKALPRVRVLQNETLEAHLRKAGDPYDPVTGNGDHDGVDIDGVHPHAPSTAKYVLLGKDGRNSRIDLHPMALDLLLSADRVFFALEGTLKNDAILSAGEAVFSVPSVTLWDKSELQRFAREHLVGKQVIVVPDADWFTNPQVDRQALYVRQAIRAAYVEAHIAAPPTDRLHLGVKGVDDFLGFGGGTLDRLVVRGREAPDSILSHSLYHWSKGQVYPRVARRALEGMSLHADEHGRLAVPMGTLGRIVGTRKLRLVEMLERHADSGAFEIEGSLAVANMRIRTKNGSWITATDWANTPTIIVAPEYRSTETTRLLGDL